jgi:ABC-2 type transport system ATP-binding protein
VPVDDVGPAREWAFAATAASPSLHGGRLGDAVADAGRGGDHRWVAELAALAVPFSEVSAHRATLEDAYLELTRDAVEFRGTAGREAAR